MVFEPWLRKPDLFTTRKSDWINGDNELRYYCILFYVYLSFGNQGVQVCVVYDRF